MMNFQEAKMGDGHEGKGKKSLTKREIRYWGATIIGLVIAVLLTSAMGYFAFDNPAYVAGGDAVRRLLPPYIAIIGSVIITLFAIWFTIYTFKIIDEQEKMAFLWANTASWYCACQISFTWFILHIGQLAPPVDGYSVITVSAFIGLAVWAWKKYF